MILDGGFATECETHGADIKEKIWSAKLIYEQPELVEKIHYDFYMAGADVAITSTYRACFEHFENKGFSHELSC